MSLIKFTSIVCVMGVASCCSQARAEFPVEVQTVAFQPLRNLARNFICDEECQRQRAARQAQRVVNIQEQSPTLADTSPVVTQQVCPCGPACACEPCECVQNNQADGPVSDIQATSGAAGVRHGGIISAVASRPVLALGPRVVVRTLQRIEERPVAGFGVRLGKRVIVNGIERRQARRAARRGC